MSEGCFKSWSDAAPLDWGGMLLRPRRAMLHRFQVGLAPAASGVYALGSADGGIDYIGKAANLNARLLQHRAMSRIGREAWFEGFAVILVPVHAVGHVEIAHIHALNPERNRLYEIPRWRGHESMVRALREIWRYEPEPI